MKRSRLLPLLIVLAFILGLAGHANAEVLFSENFESYAHGSDIVGQGGWTGQTVYVTDGNYLTGSKVLNGRYVDFADYHTILHDLSASLSSDKVTTMSFDAYATTDSYFSHNTLLGFSQNGTFASAWSPVETAYNVWSWRFANYTIAGPGNYIDITGGYDQKVTLGIVIDGTTNEIYGTYSFNGGGVTSSLSITSESIEAIDEVIAWVDTRNGGTAWGQQYDSAEFDNIIVTATVVPEPISSILFITGGSALGFRRFRKRAIVQ